MSLLGCRLDTARAARALSTIWPLVVVAGLLTVPAECARIGHPHSLFQSANAAPASPPAKPEPPPHSAADHDHAGTGDLPAWASPTVDGLASAAYDAGVSHAHPAHPNSGAPALAQQAPSSSLAGGLPIVEPAASIAITAFGTALALLISLSVLLLPGRAHAAGVIAALFGLLGPALDPPPPRAGAVAC